MNLRAGTEEAVTIRFSVWTGVSGWLLWIRIIRKIPSPFCP